jgi:Tat protein secretion system quality control protein TatD with DNase activity
VAHVATHLAACKGLRLEDVAKATSANFERLFGLPVLAEVT